MRNLINLIEEIDTKVGAQQDAEPMAAEPEAAPKKTTPDAPKANTIQKAGIPDREPVYANIQDYKLLKVFLEQEFAEMGIHEKVQYVKDAGRLPLLRISNVTPDQLRAAMLTRRGIREIFQLTDKQAISSGQFGIHSYGVRSGPKVTDEVVFTIVLRGVKTSATYAGAAKDIVLNRKDLTPVKLGLAGEYENRKSLIVATKEAVMTKVKNTKLAGALVELVDLAANRGQGNLSSDSLEYVKPFLGMISQDFGEILTPIALANDNEDITFPAGNEKLIDVTIGGKTRYSVKALGGSGTSMNSLGSLLQDYEMTLTDEGKKKLFQQGIKIWQSTRKEGSITDRICLAAKLNMIPEYISIVNILGGEFDSFKELKSLLESKVEKLDYVGFLKMILPMTQAGNWGYNVGMPEDANYYLGLTNKKPEPGVAGKYSYEHDHVDGAANICTYSLGMGMRNLMTRGPDKDRYLEIMTDMLKQMNCYLGHVSITANGQLHIASKPFSDLTFEFDYHAPSNIAGNNRPGFIIVPPKVKKEKKAKVAESRQRRDAGPNLRARRS